MAEDTRKEEIGKEEATTEGKIYEVDSGKLVTLHCLLAECINLARETLEGEFGDLASVKDGTLGKLTCDLAIALFHRAATPDQTETMLTALERGLEWFDAREEKQKAQSEKISADFQESMSAVMPKPPRRRSALERLMSSLIDVVSEFAMEEFEREEKRLLDEAEKAIPKHRIKTMEEPIETSTQEKGSPTPEEEKQRA